MVVLLEKIKTLFETNLKTQRGIKQIVLGRDLLTMPNISFPLIIISLQNVTLEEVDSCHDQATVNILIELGFDVTSYLNGQFDISAGHLDIIKIVEETEATSPKLKTNTIKYQITTQLFNEFRNFILNPPECTPDYSNITPLNKDYKVNYVPINVNIITRPYPHGRN